MPKSVEIRGLGIVRFPDTMSDQQIAQKARELAGQMQVLTRTGPVGGQEVTQAVARAEDPTGAGLARTLATAALPFLLPGAGALIGARLTPALPAIGEAALGTAGALANQILGVTKPGAGELVGTALGPAAGRTLTGAVRVGSRFFPGSRRAAETLNIAAHEEARQLPAQLAPAVPAKRLFDVARQMQVRIDTPQALSKAQDVLDELATLSAGAKEQFAVVRRYADGLVKKIQASGGSLNPSELQNELAAAGEIIARLGRSDKPGSGKIKQVFEALTLDLEKAASRAGQVATPGAEALLAARQAFLREQTTKELSELIEGAFVLRRGQASEQFNANAVLAGLKRNRFVEKAFSAAERQEIERVLRLINRVPVLPPPRGAMFGSGQFFGRLATTGAAGAGGFAAGGIPGAVAGAAVPTAIELSRNLALAVQTETGRKLLTSLLKGTDGAITPRIAAILSVFVGEAVGGTPR